MSIKLVENILIIDGEKYAIEKQLVRKLDRVVRGITQENPKEDAVLINEGKEGKGKSNSALVEAIYVKVKTRRSIHLFFRLERLIQFAQSTKEKIIIWDEPALDSLSTDQLNRLNKTMTRLFMLVRKKRHFFIINYVKFWKFPEYMIVDRSNGMVHMREDEVGRFMYIRKRRLEFLWNEFRTKHRRAYRKAMSFGGRMPFIMEKHFAKLKICVNDIPNATYEDYDKSKDEAIESIGKRAEKLDKNKIKLDKLRRKIAQVKGIFKEDLARQLGINSARLREWKKIELA